MGILISSNLSLSHPRNDAPNHFWVLFVIPLLHFHLVLWRMSILIDDPLSKYTMVKFTGSVPLNSLKTLSLNCILGFDLDKIIFTIKVHLVMKIYYARMSLIKYPSLLFRIGLWEHNKIKTMLYKTTLERPTVKKYTTEE